MSVSYVKESFSTKKLFLYRLYTARSHLEEGGREGVELEKYYIQIKCTRVNSIEESEREREEDMY